ncbi:HNH endonuclease [Breoghania sp.]|uniref:HNH endonuclease n=1 Tax=Breoghania sp. TaxID=2065378 RepID=UPI0029CA286F|nr:HNH endonuclease [Breoghania sp.]
MAFGVFIHRPDSSYDDTPAERYHFPVQYLSRVEQCVGDWIIYLEPTKIRDTRGYFAVAQLEQIIPSSEDGRMYYALIKPGSYLQFSNPVPFSGSGGIVEQSVLNEHGKISGRAQSAVRIIPEADFDRILEIGLDDKRVLPRDKANGASETLATGFEEAQAPYIFDDIPERRKILTSRTARDGVFRRVVLNAYGERCALTGLKFINGGGRAEVNAAHIIPVEHNGPDIINNGIALCGTVHWMFDRGLIGLSNDLKILISRQANDPNAIQRLINSDGYASTPKRATDRPHPRFLDWHREHVFKH